MGSTRRTVNLRVLPKSIWSGFDAIKRLLREVVESDPALLRISSTGCVIKVRMQGMGMRVLVQMVRGARCGFKNSEKVESHPGFPFFRGLCPINAIKWRKYYNQIKGRFWFIHLRCASRPLSIVQQIDKKGLPKSSPKKVKGLRKLNPGKGLFLCDFVLTLFIPLK